MRNVAKVVSVTSSEGFLVLICLAIVEHDSVIVVAFAIKEVCSSTLDRSTFMLQPWTSYPHACASCFCYHALRISDWKCIHRHGGKYLPSGVWVASHPG